jgi:hypothetical protein
MPNVIERRQDAGKGGAAGTGILQRLWIGRLH